MAETPRGRVRLFVSLRSADPLALGEAAARLIAAGVDGLHIDIADGRFVPYMAGGPGLARALAERLPGALLDVHLMTEAPEDRLRDLAESGIARVAFHLEADRYPWRVASLARRLGFSVGVALNPATPLQAVEALVRSVDFINLLTTDPDHAGEPLLPGMAERVADLRRLAPPEVGIEVDGAVSVISTPVFVGAGATELVVGRAIVGAEDWPAAVAALLVAAGGPGEPDAA